MVSVRSVDCATAEALSEAAWDARTRARVFGPTRVGCAVVSPSGLMAVGCNLEHRYRSHDIHAETNALSTLVAMGGDSCLAVLVVAERSQFTPCGACLDWIMELGGVDCIVGFQGSPEAPPIWFSAGELMPHYPI